MRLTKSQITVLAECDAAGELWQDGKNYWRWYRTLPNGMTYQAAKNPTVCVLVENGYLARIPGNRVAITSEGAAALTDHPAPAAQGE